MTTNAFLTREEISILTGRALKSMQIEQLRRMGISFFVNGAGRPVVVRSAIEGTGVSQEQSRGWSPSLVRS